MTNKIFQVDAFTAEPFRGNPAAVCLLASPQSDGWMQSLAAEMNLSETAFLLANDEGWLLRWFTPKTEVDLCGHATLASAAILFEMQPELKSKTLRFMTHSGELRARWVEGAVELDFPAMAYFPLVIPPEIPEILGFIPMDAVFSGNFFLFEAESDHHIWQTHPDMKALVELPMPELITTARSADPSYDFISRFFAPQLGVDEDPVTGSAHCLLAPYWAQKLGKTTFTAFQASSRGGTLHLRLLDDRVRIRGEAKLIFSGELCI